MLGPSLGGLSLATDLASLTESNPRRDTGKDKDRRPTPHLTGIKTTREGAKKTHVCWRSLQTPGMVSVFEHVCFHFPRLSKPFPKNLETGEDRRERRRGSGRWSRHVQVNDSWPDDYLSFCWTLHECEIHLSTHESVHTFWRVPKSSFLYRMTNAGTARLCKLSSLTFRFFTTITNNTPSLSKYKCPDTPTCKPGGGWARGLSHLQPY